MRKFRGRLAIIVAMMVFVTSFSFVGVFAEGEDLAPAGDAQMSTEASSDGTEGGEVTDPVDPPETTVTAPEPVSNLNAYCSSNSIVLLWEKSDDADVKYLVDNNPVSEKAVGSYSKVKDYTDSKGKVWNRCNITGLAPGQGKTVSVVAYKESDGEMLPSAPVKKTGWAVETIVYRVRIKKGGTLKSHGGSGPRAIRVVKGQYIDCYGFGGGKYIFNYGGSIFYCNKTRTNSRSAIYNPYFNYSRQDAEFFVNDRGVYSPTNSLIWVNTYSQHLYRFEWSYKYNRWVCANDFECSTGKASTPSPTGVSGKKAIWKKIRKRHGIKWWSPYSDINSIHSKKAKWRIGSPSSNGCIRNYENNAYDVYVNAPIGTGVLLF